MKMSGVISYYTFHSRRVVCALRYPEGLFAFSTIRKDYLRFVLRTESTI